MEGLELKKLYTSNNSTVEQYFYSFFTLLGSFACDKAKEYAEKEKELQLPTPLQASFYLIAYSLLCFI